MVLRRSKLKVCLRLKENLWSLPLTNFRKRKWSLLKKRGRGLYYPQLVKKAGHLISRRWIYANQLKTKQKLRLFYGNISEKAFRNIYRKSVLHDNFLGLLESRFDSLLYRTHLVATPFSARQAISHGRFLVNKKVVKRRGLQLRSGDLIEVKEKHFHALVNNICEHLGRQNERFSPVPNHVEVNYSICAAIFLQEPYTHEVFYGMPLNLLDAKEYFK